MLAGSDGSQLQSHMGSAETTADPKLLICDAALQSHMGSAETPAA